MSGPTTRFIPKGCLRKYEVMVLTFFIIFYLFCCFQAFDAVKMGPKNNEKVGKSSKASLEAFEPSATQKKAARTAQNKAVEEQRIRDRDSMMDMNDCGNGYDYETIDDIKSKFATDKFGNTISKAKAAEDSKVEALRAAAKARRAEKEAAALLEAPQIAIKDFTVEPKPKASKELNVDEVRAKAAAGEKLTHKEKKLLAGLEKASIEEAQRLAETQSGLSSFSISMQGQGTTGDEDATVSATDIIANNISISAPSRQLLIDTSLKLVGGRRYGLLGPNGRGKTTLLKYLAARQIPIPAGMEVLLVEQEVLPSELSVVDQVLSADRKRSQLLKEEAILSEEFEQQENLLGGGAGWDEATWRDKLERFAALGAELVASGADTCESKVRRILTGLGFTVAMQDGTSTTLSGGWRMRVALASALFLEPQLLLLDEPTNHLDLNAVLWLDDHFCNHWKHTLLVVSHDAGFLDSVCTDIIHLDDAKLNTYSGSFTDFEGMRGQIEAKKERDYKLQQKTLKELKSTGLTIEKAEKKMLQKLGAVCVIEKPREYKVSFTMHSPEEHGPAIDLLDVSFSYPNTPPIFQNLRFRVNTHSRVAIVGPNGVGKSTLLKLMTGALTPTKGDISRHNKLRVGVYNQHFEDTLPAEKTPVEFLTDQFDLPVLDARKYLGMFGLDGARHTIRIAQLSGGQKARVAFAALSLLRPHILILDEPTNHLDIESVDALITSLKAYEGGVVLVSHDARLISAIDCELWVCGDSESGLRIEHRGFERYRRDVMLETQRQQELSEKKLAERNRLRKERREKCLAKHGSKGSAQR